MDNLTANIHWLGHDSFRIDGEGVVIYIDPYRLKEGPKARSHPSITHDHSDHDLQRPMWPSFRSRIR